MLRDQQPTVGSAFKEGRGGHTLLLFEWHQIFALRPTPPRAWAWYRTDKRWRGTREPEVDLAEERRALLRARARPPQPDQPEAKPYLLRRRHNFDLFFQQVAPRVRRELAHWHHLPWAPFSLLALDERALELAEAGHRALVFMLAHVRTFRASRNQAANRAARAQLGKKRRDICGYLGLPPARSTVRLLSRLHFSAITVANLHRLRRALDDEATRKKLLHHPSVTGLLLAALSGPHHRMVSPAFLAALGEDHQGDNVARGLERLLVDTDRLLEELHPGAKPRLGSLTELLDLHGELIDEVHRREVRHLAPERAFPPPPVSPCPYEEVGPVVPLKTNRALAEEGRVMHHCLGGPHHVADALRGHYYAYAIKGRERLTLALREEAGCWLVEDLRGYANATPSTAAQRWAADFAQRTTASARRSSVASAPSVQRTAA